MTPSAKPRLSRKTKVEVVYIIYVRTEIPEFLSDPAKLSFSSEGMRPGRWEPNRNQTYPVFNVLSCVFVGNIFLGGLPLLCWVLWLSFCPTAAVGVLVTEMLTPNTEAWLKKANFLSKKNAQLTPCVKRRALLFRRASLQMQNISLYPFWDHGMFLLVEHSVELKAGKNWW